MAEQKEPLMNVLGIRPPLPGSLEMRLRNELIKCLLSSDPRSPTGQPLWRELGADLNAQDRLTFWVPNQFERNLDPPFFQLLAASPCKFTLREFADVLQQSGNPETAHKLRLVLPTTNTKSETKPTTETFVPKSPTHTLTAPAPIVGTSATVTMVETVVSKEKFDTDFVRELCQELNGHTYVQTNIELIYALSELSKKSKTVKELKKVKINYPTIVSVKFNDKFVNELDNELEGFLNKNGILDFNQAITLLLKEGNFMAQLLWTLANL